MKVSERIKAAARARAELRHGRDALWGQMEDWALQVDGMERAIREICAHFGSQNLDELWMHMPEKKGANDE